MQRGRVIVIVVVAQMLVPVTFLTPSWKRAFPGTPGMHTMELMVHNQNTHHKLTNFT